MKYLRISLFVISIAFFGFTGCNGEKPAAKPKLGASGTAAEKEAPTNQPVKPDAKLKTMSPDDF